MRKTLSLTPNVYDLNQKTMQTLESPAVVHAVFEKAGGNLDVENSECDVVFAESRAAMDEFNEAQRVQEFAREELYDAQESRAMSFMDLQESVQVERLPGSCRREVPVLEGLWREVQRG